MFKGIRAKNQPCTDCKGQATLDESDKEKPIYICDNCGNSWDAPDNKKSKNKAFKLTSTCPNCKGIAFTYMADITMWNCKTCNKQWVKEESDYGEVKEEHGFLIPTGYIFSKESGIQKITVKKSKKADVDDEEIIEDVCYAPIIITKTLQNCDTNEVSVEVSFPDSKDREVKLRVQRPSAVKLCIDYLYA